MDKQILNLAAEYLQHNGIPLHDFQQRFAGIYFQVRQSQGRSGGSALCDEIVLPLAELSRGHRSEDSFREKLAEAIAPFVVGPVYAPAREIVYGKPAQQARSANHSFRLVAAA